MLAVSASPFDSPEYLYEIKWDGIRALAEVAEGKTTLYSRNANDITRRYPELVLDPWLDKIPAVLDGEIVILQNGLPSFRTLQTRDRLQDRRKICAASRTIPAIYVAFDLLSLDGRDLTQLTLIKRKNLLDNIVKGGTHLVVSQYVLESGKLLFEQARVKGLEGVMAKRLDSLYQCGKRSPHWVKFRNTKTMSCIICGYVPGSGDRKNLGSLILGAYEQNRLVYVGNAGSGLDGGEINFLLSQFRLLVRDTSPFAAPPPLKGPVWVEPRLVCDVSYLEKGEVLRHPTFIGLRKDVRPEECTTEQG